jgi:hypothetical protein
MNATWNDLNFANDGSNYVLQVSTNLLNWSSVSTSSIPVSGTITFTNPVSGYSNSFYRAYLQ